MDYSNPNRHKPSVPEGQQRCLTLKCYSDRTPTAAWNTRNAAAFSKIWPSLCLIVKLFCLSLFKCCCWYMIYIKSVDNAYFLCTCMDLGQTAICSWRFCCLLQCCCVVFSTVCSHCFYCVCTVQNTGLLITPSYWMLITCYVKYIFSHCNPITFAHLHHKCLTN